MIYSLFTILGQQLGKFTFISVLYYRREIPQVLGPQEGKFLFNSVLGPIEGIIIYKTFIHLDLNF